MVIYAQLSETHTAALRVVSGVPVLHEPTFAPATCGRTVPAHRMTLPVAPATALPTTTLPTTTPRTPMLTATTPPTGGMAAGNESAAWLRRGDLAAAVRALGTPAAISTTTFKQRDAFAGVSPGLRSTSPPV